MSLNFNLYGLILGIAIVVALSLIEKKINKIGLELKHQYLDLGLLFVFIIVFARLWHVVSDWHLYSGNFLESFQIWNGGLSILGAIIGGVISLFIVSKIEKIELTKLLDITVFGLPIAQSIGRWGNYFNKELYGWPTDLPWGIMVNGEKHHPLFIYEAILTLSFGVYAWLKIKDEKIGKGKIFLIYLSYYSLIRFLLDFLRVDKVMINSWLGLNQLVLVFVMLFSLTYLIIREEE